MDAVASPFALELDALLVVVLTALGLIVGVLSGLFGVGGGFLLTPMLNVLLGIPYHLAVGSTLVQMAMMTWVGTLSHFKMKHVDYRLALSLVSGSFIGAEAGVRLQGVLKGIGQFKLSGEAVSGFDLTMALIFFVLLGGIGWGMAAEGRRSRRRANGNGASGASSIRAGRDEAAAARDVEHLEPEETAMCRLLSSVRVRPVLTYSSDPARRFSFWVPMCIGFLVGVMTGLLGTGGGFINLPILIYWLGVPTVVAVGTASVQTTIAAIYSGARHLMLGNVIWAVVFALLVGSLIGVRAGALLSVRIPKDRLRSMFGYVVLATALIVLVDVVRKLS